MIKIVDKKTGRTGVLSIEEFLRQAEKFRKQGGSIWNNLAYFCKEDPCKKKCTNILKLVHSKKEAN